MEQNQRIEILMAAYNGAPFIGDQIDSIFSQTDAEWHLTLSDDRSTDGTEALIDSYVARFPDKVARVRSPQRFGGAKAHFLWLTANCKADYIAYCDDDDVWRPNKLHMLRCKMREAEAQYGCGTPILVFSDQIVTDERLNPIAPSLMRYQKQYCKAFDYRSILMQNVVTGGAMMINRALADWALQCVDLSQIIMHDWWMAAVAARFGQIVYIDEPLGDYRQHRKNSVGAKDVNSAGYMLNRLSQIDALRDSILLKKAQAAVFEQTYRDRLHAEDRDFLRGFACKHSGPLFYARYWKQIHGLCRLAGFALLG